MLRDVGATCYSFGRGDADSCPSAPHARARGGRFGQCCRCCLPGWWRRVRGGEVGGVRGGRGGTDRGEPPTPARGDRCRPGCGLPGCGLCAPQEALCQSRHSASCRRGHSPSPFRGGRTVPPPAAGARSLSRTLGRAGSTDRHGLLDGSKGLSYHGRRGLFFSYPRRGSIITYQTSAACVKTPVEHGRHMDDCPAACTTGRFLRPECKRRVNAEGLGSSLVSWRAGLAYALLLNLPLADEPLVVGHGPCALSHSSHARTPPAPSMARPHATRIHDATLHPTHRPLPHRDRHRCARVAGPRRRCMHGRAAARRHGEWRAPPRRF